MHKGCSFEIICQKKVSSWEASFTAHSVFCFFLGLVFFVKLQPRRPAAQPEDCTSLKMQAGALMHASTLRCCVSRAKLENEAPKSPGDKGKEQWFFNYLNIVSQPCNF